MKKELSLTILLIIPQFRGKVQRIAKHLFVKCCTTGTVFSGFLSVPSGLVFSGQKRLPSEEGSQRFRSYYLNHLSHKIQQPHFQHFAHLHTQDALALPILHHTILRMTACRPFDHPMRSRRHFLYYSAYRMRFDTYFFG